MEVVVSNLKRAYFSHEGKEIHRRNLQAWVSRELPTSGTRKDEKNSFQLQTETQRCMILVHPEILFRPLSRSTSAVSLLSKRWLKPAIPHRGESHIRSALCISNSQLCLENDLGNTDRHHLAMKEFGGCNTLDRASSLLLYTFPILYFVFIFSPFRFSIFRFTFSPLLAR